MPFFPNSNIMNLIKMQIPILEYGVNSISVKIVSQQSEFAFLGAATSVAAPFLV